MKDENPWVFVKAASSFRLHPLFFPYGGVAKW